MPKSSKRQTAYSHLPNCRGGGGGSNKLKWVEFSEINRPKTKNYPTRSYKILQNPEFTPPTIRQVRVNLKSFTLLKQPKINYSRLQLLTLKTFPWLDIYFVQTNVIGVSENG